MNQVGKVQRGTKRLFPEDALVEEDNQGDNEATTELDELFENEEGFDGPLDFEGEFAERERAMVAELIDETLLPAPEKPRVIGRFPIPLYLSCNDDFLSPYQCLLRKQVELFEAYQVDVDANQQGRNKPITLGQVGIRCRHCVNIAHKNRSRGSIFYPSKLLGVYQATQNMAKVHLLDQCTSIPPEIKEELLKLNKVKSRTSGGGKGVWGAMAKAMGVYEDTCGLRFTESITEFVN